MPLQHPAANHLRVGGGGLGAVAVRPAQAAQTRDHSKVDIDAKCPLKTEQLLKHGALRQLCKVFVRLWVVVAHLPLRP